MLVPSSFLKLEAELAIDMDSKTCFLPCEQCLEDCIWFLLSDQRHCLVLHVFVFPAIGVRFVVAGSR